MSDESQWQDFVKTGQTIIKHDDALVAEPIQDDTIGETIHDSSPINDQQTNPKQVSKAISGYNSRNPDLSHKSISEPPILDALGQCYGVVSPHSPRKQTMTKV